MSNDWKMWIYFHWRFTLARSDDILRKTFSAILVEQIEDVAYSIDMIRGSKKRGREGNAKETRNILEAMFRSKHFVCRGQCTRLDASINGSKMHFRDEAASQKNGSTSEFGDTSRKPSEAICVAAATYAAVNRIAEIGADLRGCLLRLIQRI